MAEFMYYVYILGSCVAQKTYVGHTRDLEKRLETHNSGKSKFTKQYKPWKILFSQRVENREKAVQREKYFKSSAGRRWIKKNLFNN